MVGPLTQLEALLALAVFATVLFLSRRRLRKSVVRFVRRKARAFNRWLAATNRKHREKAAEFQDGHVISKVRTIDGDTFEDTETRVRYRVANIDCPETDDRARCHRERIKGEQAKGAAEMIIATAQRIEVRPVGRIDPHGRTVAYVHVDEQDFGRLMIAKGFAVRWDGQRGSWCGKDGGLAVLAKATSGKHVCKTCGAGSPAEPSPQSPKPNGRVISLNARQKDGLRD